jgi:hypothetical protein
MWACINAGIGVALFALLDKFRQHE